MRTLLVASSTDPAGSRLMAALGDRMIPGVERLVVDASLLDWSVPHGFDLVIFLSKHQAASGIAAMCVHSVGNFGTARFGGRDGMLVDTHPGILSSLFRSLRDREPSTALGTYTVSLEAVHHGPYSTTPSIFFELGSAREHWEDVDAARIMAEVLIDVFEQPRPQHESFFGIGSNHYCAAFEPIIDEFDFAGSCAKHSLADLSAEHVDWIEQRVDRIIVDSGSLGSQKQRIKSLLEEREVEWV